MRTLSLALFALLLTVPRPAAAQSDEDIEARARELFQNGAILYEEGRYEDAIVAWEEAYRLSERPALLYNIANAEERLGLLQDAYDTLSRYRAWAKADEREALDRRIRNLERRIEEQGAVDTTVARAAATPTPTPDPATPSKGGGVRVLPVALIGVGAAGLGTGTVFALRASAARREAGDLCVEGATGVLCPDDAEGALDRDFVSSLVADIAFGVGGLALAGGVVTFVVGGQPTATGPALTLQLGGAF